MRRNQKIPGASSTRFLLVIDPNYSKNSNASSMNKLESLQKHGFIVKTTNHIGNALNILNSSVGEDSKDLFQIFVICTNQNSEEVHKELNNDSEFGRKVKGIYIFCATLKFGEQNIQRFGNKFKKAFVNAEELKAEIRLFSSLKNGEHSNPHESEVQNEKMIQRAKSSHQFNIQSLDEQRKQMYDKKPGSPEKVHLSKLYHIGHPYIEIGGKPSKKSGKQYLLQYKASHPY